VHQPHAVCLDVEDDYDRNRLTVFLRLLLAIPHLIWFLLWTVLMQTLEDPSPPWWDYVFLQNHPTLVQRIEMTRYYAAAQSP
jgi:hypothetical protein